MIPLNWECDWKINKDIEREFENFDTLSKEEQKDLLERLHKDSEENAIYGFYRPLENTPKEANKAYRKVVLTVNTLQLKLRFKELAEMKEKDRLAHIEWQRKWNGIPKLTDFDSIKDARFYYVLMFQKRECPGFFNSLSEWTNYISRIIFDKPIDNSMRKQRTISKVDNFITMLEIGTPHEMNNDWILEIAEEYNHHKIIDLLIPRK